MTSRVIRLSKHKGVEYHAFCVDMEQVAYLVDTSIMSFSFKYPLESSEKGITAEIGILFATGPCYITFTQDGMGEFHRIKRELEIVFGVKQLDNAVFAAL